MIVDVRRHPGSKSFPQFNKKIMTKELVTINIEYKHIEKLWWWRKEIANPLIYDNSAWQNKSFRYYEDYMATISFKQGIKELLYL